MSAWRSGAHQGDPARRAEVYVIWFIYVVASYAQVLTGWRHTEQFALWTPTAKAGQEFGVRRPFSTSKTSP